MSDVIRPSFGEERILKVEAPGGPAASVSMVAPTVTTPGERPHIASTGATPTCIRR